MRKIKILAILAITLLVSTCKKDNNQIDPTKVSLLNVTKVLTATEDKFLEFGLQSGTSPQKALGLAAEWLKTQPLVSSADVLDNTVISIKMKSGIPTLFFLDITDQNGKSLYRGGGSGNHLLKFVSNNQSKHLIENKKVLLCYPNAREFYDEPELDKILDNLRISPVGLEVTEKINMQVDPDLISTFGDYGLVIINTHGIGDAFLIGSTLLLNKTDTTDQLVKDFIIKQFSQKTCDNITLGLLRIGGRIRLSSNPDWARDYRRKDGEFCMWVGSEYIKSLPDMPNTIIFGNFCYSGQTNIEQFIANPIGAAFKGKNLISYYCYNDGNGSSGRVDNAFAKQMADSLVSALTADLDSTGIAHLRSTGKEFQDQINSFFFKQFGAPDYSYSNCVNVFTDNRDGIIYKAACIGKQSWMAENLRYNAPGSLFYEDNPANGPVYGKLYNWNIAMNGAGPSAANPSGVQGICPKGWHLPSQAEWNQLFDFLGGPATAGKALKSTSGWVGTGKGTNTSGFTAVGAGHWDWALNTYANLGISTLYWASEEFDPEWRAWYLVLFGDRDKAELARSYKKGGGSVRCVKDR